MVNNSVFFYKIGNFIKKKKLAITGKILKLNLDLLVHLGLPGILLKLLLNSN